MSGFFSQIITSFGYTPEQSLLLDTPAGVVGFAAIYMNGYFGDKLKNRILVASTGSIFAMIGMSLIVTLPLSNRGGRLAGYYITQTAPMGLVTLLSLISTNVAGYTKKTTVAGLYFVGYCVGNIIGEMILHSASDFRDIEVSRSPNLYDKRRSSICHRRNRHYRMLGCYVNRFTRYILVLQPTEYEEST